MIPFSLAYDILKIPKEKFLSLCKTENYQASGPGGQKRNRKLSAVRLTNIATNISVTASEYREGNRNLSSAINRLRLKIALNATVSNDEDLNNLIVFRDDFGENNYNFAIVVLRVFSYLDYCSGSVRETADKLSISSSRLIRFLKKNKQVWSETQKLRQKYTRTLLK